MVMLAKDPTDRIDQEMLLGLPYFAEERQLKLYHMLADNLVNYDDK